MHFVTGGAFNGKRRWVKNRYKEGNWLSAYDGDPFKIRTNGSLQIYEGIEQWIKEEIKEKEIEEVRHIWRERAALLESWEKEKVGRQVVFIGADITKGIVPLEKEMRQWRDATGWVYQDLVSRCSRVDLIWYGLNEPLKGKGDH